MYRKALELEPHNPKIHCNLGFLYWGKGDTEEAIKSNELAIKYNDKYVQRLIILRHVYSKNAFRDIRDVFFNMTYSSQLYQYILLT